MDMWNELNKQTLFLCLLRSIMLFSTFSFSIIKKTNTVFVLQLQWNFPVYQVFHTLNAIRPNCTEANPGSLRFSSH